MANIERSYHDITLLDKATALGKVKDVMDISSSAEFFIVVKNPDSIRSTCRTLSYVEGHPEFSYYIKPFQHYTIKAPASSAVALSGGTGSGTTKFAVRCKITRLEFNNPTDSNNINSSQSGKPWTTSFDRMMRHFKVIWLYNNTIYFTPFLRDLENNSSDSDKLQLFDGNSGIAARYHFQTPLSNIKVLEFDAYEVHRDSTISSTDKSKIFGVINRTPHTDDYSDVVMLTQSTPNRFSLSVKSVRADYIDELCDLLDKFDALNGKVAYMYEQNRNTGIASNISRTSTFLHNYIQANWPNEYDTDRVSACLKQLDPGPMRFEGRQFYPDQNNDYWKRRLTSGEPLILYSDLNHHAATFARILIVYLGIIEGANVKIHTHSTRELFRDITVRSITHDRKEELVIGMGQHWNDVSYTSAGIRFVENVNFDGHDIGNVGSITVNDISSYSAHLGEGVVVVDPTDSEAQFKVGTSSVNKASKFFGNVTITGVLSVASDFTVAGMATKYGNTNTDISITTYSNFSVSLTIKNPRATLNNIQFVYTYGGERSTSYTWDSQYFYNWNGTPPTSCYYSRNGFYDSTSPLYFAIYIYDDSLGNIYIKDVDGRNFKVQQPGRTNISIAISVDYPSWGGTTTGTMTGLVNDLNGSPFVVMGSDGHFYKTDITFNTGYNTDTTLTFNANTDGSNIPNSGVDYTQRANYRKFLASDGQWQALTSDYTGFANSNHSHGNINKIGKIISDTTIPNNTNTYKLVLTDNSSTIIKSSLNFDNTSITNKKSYLSKYGTFNTIQDLLFHGSNNTTSATFNGTTNGDYGYVSNLNDAIEPGIYRFTNSTTNIPSVTDSTSTNVSDSLPNNWAANAPGSAYLNAKSRAYFESGAYGIVLVLTDNGLSAGSFNSSNNAERQNIVQIAFTGTQNQNIGNQIFMRAKGGTKGDPGNWGGWTAVSKIGHNHDRIYPSIADTMVKGSLSIHSTIRNVGSATETTSRNRYTTMFNHDVSGGDQVFHRLYSTDNVTAAADAVSINFGIDFIDSTNGNAATGIAANGEAILTLSRYKNSSDTFDGKRAVLSAPLTTFGNITFDDIFVSGNTDTNKPLPICADGSTTDYVILASINGTTATLSRSSTITHSELQYLNGMGENISSAISRVEGKIDNHKSTTGANDAHGNLKSNGTIGGSNTSVANGDVILIGDISSSTYSIARSNISFDASTTSKYLSPKGTWESMPGVVTTATNGSGGTNGLMTAVDKERLDIIYNSFSTDDSDNVVNRLKDVLTVLTDFPEGTKVLTALNSKLTNYGASPNLKNGTTITQPGGSNAISMLSAGGTGKDTGIFRLSDDNAYICNSSDDNYLFATFDTDKTTNFSSAGNAAFAVLSDHAGVSMKGNLSVAGNVSATNGSFSGTVSVANKVTMQYNSNEDCLDFIFA